MNISVIESNFTRLYLKIPSISGTTESYLRDAHFLKLNPFEMASDKLSTFVEGQLQSMIITYSVLQDKQVWCNNGSTLN